MPTAFEDIQAKAKAREEYDRAVNPEASFSSGYDLGYHLEDNVQYQADSC